LIFHHTDYKSHDPEKNPFFHNYLCKKLEEGTKIKVSFNEASAHRRAPVSGVLRYKVWHSGNMWPFLVNDDGVWEAIIPQDNVELI
jgi:hypothetical protein